MGKYASQRNPQKRACAATKRVGSGGGVCEREGMRSIRGERGTFDDNDTVAVSVAFGVEVHLNKP